MKYLAYFFAAFILFTFVISGISYSIMDKSIIYYGAGEGKVVFDHQLHASKGMVCIDCHTKYFETQKKALFRMDDHFSDKKCFGCHNGKNAFNECNQCHRKL